VCYVSAHCKTHWSYQLLASVWIWAHPWFESQWMSSQPPTSHSTQCIELTLVSHFVCVCQPHSQRRIRSFVLSKPYFLTQCPHVFVAGPSAKGAFSLFQRCFVSTFGAPSFHPIKYAIGSQKVTCVNFFGIQVEVIWLRLNNGDWRSNFDFTDKNKVWRVFVYYLQQLKQNCSNK